MCDGHLNTPPLIIILQNKLSGNICKTPTEKSTVGLFINKFADSFTKLSSSFFRTPQGSYLSRFQPHLLVQIQKWKHHNITWNLFEVQNIKKTSEWRHWHRSGIFWCIQISLIALVFSLLTLNMFSLFTLNK